MLCLYSRARVMGVDRGGIFKWRSAYWIFQWHLLRRFAFDLCCCYSWLDQMRTALFLTSTRAGLFRMQRIRADHRRYPAGFKRHFTPWAEKESRITMWTKSTTGAGS